MSSETLTTALRQLEHLLRRRLIDHFRDPAAPATSPLAHGFFPEGPADLGGDGSLSADEQVIMLLALAPHLRADFFGPLIAEHLPDGGDLPEFGGVRGVQHRGVLPTGETAQFVLAGTDLGRRGHIHGLLGADAPLARTGLVRLEPVPPGEPVLSGRLSIDPDQVDRLTTGVVQLPTFGIDFPAEHLDTAMGWDDLILPEATRNQIRQIEHWVTFHDMVFHDWGLGRRVKPGYRVLFHGPPGTGKTLTATLLGQATERPVFRVDLSRIVSKYIGETAQNLGRLFDRAEHRDWILFFDEADALFGKRTEIRDAHDRYQNQEVAYLLQRIEAFDGLVILATNLRGNLDEAFLRRFQQSVPFQPPTTDERHALWTGCFPSQLDVADDVDWRDVAARFELTGAGIVNIAHACAIEALGRGDRCIDRATLDTSILRELVKEGKVV